MKVTFKGNQNQQATKTRKKSCQVPSHTTNIRKQNSSNHNISKQNLNNGSDHSINKSNHNNHVKSMKSVSTKPAQINYDQQTTKYLKKTLNILSRRFKIKPPSNRNSNTNGHSNQGGNSKTCTSQKILNLSTSVYKIVKDNITDQETDHVFINSNESNNQGYDTSKKKGGKHTESIKQHCSVNIREELLGKNKLQEGNYSSNKNKFSKNNSTKNSRKVIVSSHQNKENLKPRVNSAMGQMQDYEGNSVLDASSICMRKQIQIQKNDVKTKKRSFSNLDSYFKQKFTSNEQEDEAEVQKKLRVLKALKKTQQLVGKSHRSQLSSQLGNNTLLNLNSEMIDEKSIVIDKLRGRKIQKLR